MQFTVNRNYFFEELSKVNKIIDTKTEIIEQANIKVNVEINQITLIGVSRKMSLKIVLNDSSNLEIKSVGSFLIKGKQIIDILRKLDDDTLTISNIEKDIILITDTNSEYSMSCLTPEAFEDFIFFEEGKYISLDISELKRSINQTIVTVNDQCIKHYLRGLNFSMHNQIFYICGTDNTRISIKKIEFINKTISEMNSTLPKETVNELIKVLPDSGECKIIINENFVNFIFENNNFQCSTLEGTYPDVVRFWDIEFKTELEFPLNKFKRLIWRSDISNDQNVPNEVNFNFSNNEINISSNLEDKCSFKEKYTDFNYLGESYQSISFNAKFLYDALKTFDTEKISVKILDSSNPLLIESLEYKNLKHIILPLQQG